MTSLPRIAQPCDRRAVKRFLERLSPTTVQSRYLSAWTTLSSFAAERETRRLLDRDPDRHVVLVATEGDAVRGIGEFVIEGPGRAELALMVEDGYQRRGIGRRLFRRLEELATRRGISGFTADVSGGNLPMQTLLRSAGRPVHAHPETGQVRFTISLLDIPGASRNATEATIEDCLFWLPIERLDRTRYSRRSRPADEPVSCVRA
jgi:GNAT superfamily N-acetyltransferase